MRSFALLCVLALVSSVSAQIEPRKPWTTGKILGTPEPPPPFQTTVPFKNLRFDHPLFLVKQPGTNRLFVGEQAGKIWWFDNSPDAKPTLFVDLKKEILTVKQCPEAKEVEAVYGMVFHPNYQQNHQVFICYSLKGNKGKKGIYDLDKNLPDGERLSRFTVITGDQPKIDFKSEKILLTWLQGGHMGGDLHFGPDGYLYATTGDATDPSPPDVFNTGQDISDLLSSILRIDVNGDADGKGYSIPKDNPFVNTPKARPEVWAYGFRNPWRMSFDKANGDLWVGDVGWELWEMVHKVEKGGNYGWSIVEGRQPIRADVAIGPTPIIPPVIEYPHTVGASVTGGYIYRGKKFPELVGAYIFGDWETRKIWAARFDNGRLKSMDEITEASVRVVAFGEDHEGEIYALDYDTGKIHSIEKRPPQAQQERFPTKLSETGLFADVAKHTYATGVIPYDVALPRWDDGAKAVRFLALPADSHVTWHQSPKHFESSMFSRTLEFPKNTVIGRTMTLEVLVNGAPKVKKLETQILHHDGRDWRGYVYAWNDAQTDAELVGADGGEVDVVVKDDKCLEGKRHQTWTHASRAQCTQCHTPWAQSILGFSIEQLNRGEGDNNLLVQYEKAGIIKRVDAKGKPRPPLNNSILRNYGKLTPVNDAGGKLEDKAKSYFHVNCGSCHRFGGGGSVEVMLHLGEDNMRAINIKPKQGDFGLPQAHVVTPGHPERSALLYRMAKSGSGRMPHIGSECVDSEGVKLIAAWIQSLQDGNKGLTSNTPEECVKRLSQHDTALALAVDLAAGHLDANCRTAVLQAAAKLQPGPIKDLFEGYLPKTGERKLGANPKWLTILAKNGDPAKGKALFFHQNQTCKNCHQLEGQGVALGPDLSKLGATRTREDLLESLLDPSRRVEAKYQNYNLKTEDGRAINGLLVKKDDKEVVLKDAENKDHTVARSNIASFTPSILSIMPSGLLANMTAQEAADLLAYLKSLK